MLGERDFGGSGGGTWIPKILTLIMILKFN